MAANVIPNPPRLSWPSASPPAHSRPGRRSSERGVAEALAAIDPDALSLDCSQGYGAVECNCDASLGFQNITVNYGTDVPNLDGDHARYLYGPGDILVAHSDHEAVTVGDLEVAVEGYKRLVKHILSEP